MSTDSTPLASSESGEASSDSSTGGTAATQPPSSDALRHPTGPTGAPAQHINAASAPLGSELHATTAMFPAVSPLHRGHGTDHPTGKRLGILTLTALGVVYGDIGTSPLYALKECFSPLYGLQPTQENVFGVLSLVVWALTLVVSVKYVSFILRADNRGEGGTFALLALIFPRRSPDSSGPRGRLLVMLALFGTALLYGDGIITPAMSVLGALEGIEVATPSVATLIVPIAVVILGVLFAAQRVGTDRVGKLFGPLMAMWFIVIAVLGVFEIVKVPSILASVNPMYAVAFAKAHGSLSFFVLGSVVLVNTGGEA